MQIRTKFTKAARKLARNPWWGIASLVLGIAIISLTVERGVLMDRDHDAATSGARSGEINAVRILDPNRLTRSLVRLDVAIEPTFTPGPTATPRPTATPEPVLVAAPAAAAAPSGPEACAAAMSGPALALFNGMNAARSNAGLPALASDSCVTYVARGQAAAMAGAGVLSHETGGDSFSILRSHGVGFGWAGENIARNSYAASQSAAVTIRAFMNSAEHRDNILNSNFSRAGVGMAVDGAGVIYFAVVFVG